MEDRITSLTDGILLNNILSLLPMRDAVRTAILSSKWRYIGKFIPNLDFEASNILGERLSVDNNSFKLGKDRRAAFFLERKLDFMKGIDQFLDLRPSGIKIVSMRIHLSLDVDDAFHLNRWIKFAFSSGIEKLDVILFEYLSIDIEKYYIFPLDLLSHVKATRLSSLKSLKLKCLSMRYHPKFDGFKSLTALYLDIVAVSDGDLVKIISICPLLELIYIFVPSLVSLEIPSSCFRLKHLEVEGGLKIKNISINAPNVISFKYSGKLINFSFAKLAQIKHIKFNFRGDSCEWLKYVFTKIPQFLPHLEFIELYCHTDIETKSFPDDFPHFTNLKRLKLNQYTSPRYNLLWIIPLLKACPILRDLRLEFSPKDYNSIYTGEVAKLQPSCHLKYLKVIEISGFTGFWSQIDLVSRLLKNANVLDIMTINHRAEFERDGKYEIFDCYGNVKHWRRRINRFISKKVPMGTKLVVL